MSSLAAQQRFAGFSPDELLGTVAHELRQPLSNIEAVAYYLSMILPPGDAKMQAHMARIRELVEQANWILSSGLSLSGPARAVPQPVALEELITESVSSCGAARADIILALAGDLPPVRLDPREGRDLVDSLLTLFRTIAAGAGPVTVTTSARAEGGVTMELQAPGGCSPGVAGSELAIENARRIAAAQGGTFVMDAGCPGGIRARLMLP